MRKQVEGLSAIVKHTFGQGMMTGDYIVFINRAKNRCKVLCWDRDGFALWGIPVSQFQAGRDGHGD